MSRSAEEALALEERIRRMKLNSERLARRHLEVEEDKLHAAQQNALVQVVQPAGNDWVIRNRHTEFEYVDSRPPQPPLEFGEGRVRGRGRGRGRGEPRRSWSNEHDDRADDEPVPRRNAPGFEQRPGRERWSAKNSPNTPGNSANVGRGDAGGMVIGNWEDPATESWRTPRRSNQDVIPSKVFSNTSREGPPHKAKYRLSEGEGPPPDPSYSFLGDSMRDGNRNPGNRNPGDRGPGDRVPERRKEISRGMGQRSDRPPGSGRTIANQDRNKRSPMSQQSYEEWRRERDAIDQRRIDRQKTSDGHWSREWDNDKIAQNDASPPRYSGGDNWGNSRRRYNNRFGDFLDESFQKRTRNRSNHNQLNSSGSSDSKSPEKDGAFHEQRNFKGRQIRRQFSNDNNFNKSAYDSPPAENRRSFGSKSANSARLESRLEAARKATGPVASTLRQFDTDVCTVTLPSSSPMKEDSRDAGPSNLVSPDKRGQASGFSSVTSPTLKVSITTDQSGKRKRVVEGVACPDLATHGTREKKHSDGAGGSKKRKQRMAKTRKTRTSQSSVSKDGDESWEDLSSEDDVSFVADLPGPSSAPSDTSKCQDASSGPESLDPIPAANKEEELLWEEFHPAGFQNNMTLAMVTETAYKALLSKGETTENGEQCKAGSDLTEGDPTLSADKLEENTPSLDPILVVTQIVKAEVDCMSLTSLTTDSSLPEDINVVPQSEARPEEAPSQSLNAEELSGPVSILEIAPQKAEASSDTEGSFQSADSPKSQIVATDVEKKENSTGVETKATDPSMEVDENGTEEKKPQADCIKESASSDADVEKAEGVSHDLKSEQVDTSNTDEREEIKTLENRSSKESETVNEEHRKKDASESRENGEGKSCGNESVASDLDAKVDNEEACQSSNGDKGGGATKNVEEAVNDKETNADTNSLPATQPSEMNR